MQSPDERIAFPGVRGQVLSKAVPPVPRLDDDPRTLVRDARSADEAPEV